MQIEATAVRRAISKSASTSWDRSLFSPSNTSLCYCGEVIAGPFPCPDCSEAMTRALLQAIPKRPRVEVRD